MSDIVVNSAEECAQAIRKALTSMDPPLDVFDGVVRLIAHHVPYVKQDVFDGVVRLITSASITYRFSGMLRLTLSDARPSVDGLSHMHRFCDRRRPVAL